MSATALKSTPQMKEALALRSLDDELQVIRQKVEGSPDRYSGFGKLLDRAAGAIQARNVRGARDDLIAIKQRMTERDAELDTAAQQAEQARLADARGAPTHTSETGVSTRDGWLWLVNKGRYSPARVDAGNRFATLYAKARETSLRSCINDAVGGGAGNTSREEARFIALDQVDAIKKNMIQAVGLASGNALYELLCHVVGNRVTVRQLAGGKDRDAEAKVIELGFALDIAGVYLGAVRT